MTILANLYPIQISRLFSAAKLGIPMPHESKTGLLGPVGCW